MLPGENSKKQSQSGIQATHPTLKNSIHLWKDLQILGKVLTLMSRLGKKPSMPGSVLAKPQLLKISSACYDGIQLVDWEKDICWEEQPSEIEADSSERDSDDQGSPSLHPPHTPKHDIQRRMGMTSPSSRCDTKTMVGPSKHFQQYTLEQPS